MTKLKTLKYNKSDKIMFRVRFLTALSPILLSQESRSMIISIKSIQKLRGKRSSVSSIDLKDKHAMRRLKNIVMPMGQPARRILLRKYRKLGL